MACSEDDDEELNNEFLFNVSVLDLLNFGGPNLMKSGDEVWKSSHVLSVGVISVGTRHYS